MKRETVVKHVHTCGTACTWQGKSLWCPACEVAVIDPVMLLRLETWSEPEPPEAA